MAIRFSKTATRSLILLAIALTCVLCVGLFVPSSAFAASSVSTPKVGWTKGTDGNRYYFKSAASRPTTGWFKINGSCFYLNPDKNGAMTTGWAKIGSKRYYFGSDGVKRTGWLKNSGKQYYLGSDGAMKTGWVKIASKRYYFASNGAMKTGWVKYGGKWYYLSKSAKGAMLRNTKKLIGNKVYAFDSSGARCKLSKVKGRLNARDWVKHAQQRLGVPNKSNITFTIDASKRIPLNFTDSRQVNFSGKGNLWVGAGIYTRFITFYENGETCAFAACNADTGAPERTIYGYTPPYGRS